MLNSLKTHVKFINMSLSSRIRSVHA